MISRLVVCLGSGEEDVSHWAVVLLHDIAMLGPEACHTLLQAPSLIRALASKTYKDIIAPLVKMAPPQKNRD